MDDSEDTESEDNEESSHGITEVVRQVINSQNVHNKFHESSFFHLKFAFKYIANCSILYY